MDSSTVAQQHGHLTHNVIYKEYHIMVKQTVAAPAPAQLDDDNVIDMIEQQFKTKVDKDGDAITTNATFDFTGVTMRQLQELCIRPLVIMAQACYRTTGVIPASDNIRVLDMLATEKKTGGRKLTIESISKKVSTMTPAEKAYLRKMLEEA